MANDGRQAVLRTLRSISRAKGRVSMVIIILLMLVDSEGDCVCAFELQQLMRERSDAVA